MSLLKKDNMSCYIALTEDKSIVHPYNNVEIHSALWLGVALGLEAQGQWIRYM